MAITTTLGHVSRALSFFNKSNIYFGFGKQTPWEDEENPPKPSIDITEIDDPLGFKKIENKYMVIPDEQGTLIYRDSKWTIIPASEAYKKKSRWVYVECYLRYGELPMGSYRQLGILTDPKLAEKTPLGKTALLPGDITEQGILEIVDNRKQTVRQSDQKELLSIIIEF